MRRLFLGELDKVCANADCGWLFYDDSRNRSRRWCDGRYCGNLIKVRRFRAKVRSSAARRRTPGGSHGG
ncbi:MAG: CGNR zinc finger domain-containing protein [Firmicutes bacterium]|nr:CGNR zinc finger domain-containing protein [Bacillota bacterium]